MSFGAKKKKKKKRKGNSFILSKPKNGPDFTHNARPDFRRRQTRGLLIMWTVLIQGELANMTELTDGEKNLMLLVCLNGEIKESENTEFRELNTTERLPSLSCQWGPRLYSG